MKILPWLLLLGATGFAGCTTLSRTPSDVAHIKLERADSPVVWLGKIWLERKTGPLLVKGYVIKRLDAKDTTQTHLDVTLYDAHGAVLLSTVEHFEPRQIPRRHRRPDYASYSVPLDPLLGGTVRIEISAHEGNHS